MLDGDIIYMKELLKKNTSERAFFKKITRRELLGGALQMLGGALTLGYVVRNERINRDQTETIKNLGQYPFEDQFETYQWRQVVVNAHNAVVEAMNLTRREMGLKPIDFIEGKWIEKE